ncbi:MAG: PASTA domain-containing protein [Prevotella sp.]|nr:PASTA domain-containing protein [Prevotella sp.]
MDIKQFLGKFKSLYLWGNILAMILVVVVLLVGLQFGLDIYTRHGEGVEVPKIVDMNIDKARVLADELGLEILVSDSGYNKRIDADCILAQTPGPGAKVKSGHAIYVTVNSASSPTVTIPDLIDNSSLREAEAKLTAMGFKMLPPQKITGEKDWVYGIISRGRRVGTGDRVSIDAPLTLIVGSGGYEDTEVLDYDDEGYSDATADDFEEVTAPPAVREHPAGSDEPVKKEDANVDDSGLGDY